MTSRSPEPTPILHLAALALPVLVVACGNDDGVPAPGATHATSTTAATSATYYKNVKPIFDAKCGKCHTEGGIAPFATDDPTVVAEYAPLIKIAVENKTMPPWLAGDGCTDYVADRSLDDAQIATIGQWADAGAPIGDPADVGAPLDTGPDYALSRVDLSLEMPVEYTAKITPDEYRCFVVDWPEEATKFATGFRAKPGNAAVVHHVIAYVAGPGQAAAVDQLDAADDGPGYQCFGGYDPTGNTLDPQQVSFLGGWAPGGPGNDFPKGTGVRIEPGAKVMLQVHYNSLTAGVQPDRTRIEVKLDDQVEKEAWIQPWTNPQWLSGDAMLIPAGQKDVVHKFEIDPTPYISGGDAITVYSATLHMHVLGKSGRIWIDHEGGSSECLLDIPRWNFHWQNPFGFAEPKLIAPGDRLGVECHWDNTTASDVVWGEGTTDEMCVGFLYMTK